MHAVSAHLTLTPAPAKWLCGRTKAYACVPALDRDIKVSIAPGVDVPSESPRAGAVGAVLGRRHAPLGQILTWAITIVVVRLLNPGDYGLLAMAMVFMGFLSLVAEAGLGLALIQAPTLDKPTLRKIFGVVILVNGVLFALQFATAPLVARYFDEQRLVAIVPCASGAVPVVIFAVIPERCWSQLDFKRQSMIGLASSVLGSLSSLGWRSRLRRLGARVATWFGAFTLSRSMS